MGGGRKRNGKADRQRRGQQRSVYERAAGAGEAAAAAATAEAAGTAAVAVPGAAPRGAVTGLDLGTPLTHTVRAAPQQLCRWFPGDPVPNQVLSRCVRCACAVPIKL